MMRGANRGKFLAKLTLIGANRRIRDVKNFWNAAIVGFDLVNLRPGMPVGKLEDILEIGASP
jgi:hypothetical protein